MCAASDPRLQRSWIRGFGPKWNGADQRRPIKRRLIGSVGSARCCPRGVSWQATKTWKASNDPDFVAKLNRVLDLYDKPPDPAVTEQGYRVIDLLDLRGAHSRRRRGRHRAADSFGYRVTDGHSRDTGRHRLEERLPFHLIASSGLTARRYLVDVHCCGPHWLIYIPAVDRWTVTGDKTAIRSTARQMIIAMTNSPRQRLRHRPRRRQSGARCRGVRCGMLHITVETTLVHARPSRRDTSLNPVQKLLDPLRRDTYASSY